MATLKKILTTSVYIFLTWLLGYGLFVAVVLNTTPQEPDKKTDAIVVLTGGENRIEASLELFANDMAPELFISGVYPSVKKANIVKKWKSEKPLPVCCITLGHKATTTYQNARETKDWIEANDIKTIRLVTANYHMNRAFIEFRNRMPDITILEHPIIQPEAVPSKLWFWLITMEEYNKTLIRWADFILTPPPKPDHNNHHGEQT